VPRTADAITRRKLAISKQVYLEGSRQRAKTSSVGRLLAVVGYDLAVETALKAAIRFLDPKVSLKGDFPHIIGVAKSALQSAGLGDLTDVAAIQHVHDVRNAAQHEGRLPTSEEVDESHFTARSFLDHFLAQVWGHSLDSIAASELVADAECKAHLDAAEAAFTAGDFTTAIARAAEALAWALLRVKNALVGRGDTWVRAILTEDSFGKPKASRELTQSIERTQQTVLYVALGLDYGDYVRYQAVAGSVTFMMAGSAHHYGAKENPDQADAEAVIAYASEAVTQIEARVGSIARPFGREHWY
jgi:hypothetical protein